MKTKSIELKSIEARRYINRSDRPRQVRIDHNSSVTNIGKMAENQATVEFQYTASFGPVGVIKIEGSFIFEDEKSQKLFEEWKKTRKMPNPIASQIHTAIMHACVPEAVIVAKDISLPPPIPLPQVRLGADPKKGQFGPEVA